jgi:hypothetical protein
VQYRPTAEELLDCMAALLEDQVLPAVAGPIQHQVRVAANLARILQREAQLGPDAIADEAERLSELLGHPGEVATLRAELTDRLAAPDLPFEDRAWEAVVAIVRRDLAIAKPGHDAWEGE